MTSKKQQIINANVAHPDWTPRDVANLVGTTPDYVRRMGYECGLVFRSAHGVSQVRVEQIDRIKRLLEQNPLFTVRQVAAILDVSRSTVANIGYRHGLKFGRCRSRAKASQTLGAAL